MSNIINQIPGHEFGKSMAATKDNRIFFISAPLDKDGVVFLYQRANEDDTLVRSLVLTPPTGFFNTQNCRFGESISVSDDGNILAVGIPNASGVKTRLVGPPIVGNSYTKGDISIYRETFFKALENFVLGFSNPLASQVFYIPADRSGTSQLQNEGAVAIYVKTGISTYALQTIITSSFPEANKKFGASVKISNIKDGIRLFVSSDNGTIEIFNYLFSGEWSSEKTYSDNDTVRLNGVFYRSIIDQNSSSPINNITEWAVVSSPWSRNMDKNYRGQWDNSDSYVAGVFVAKDGAVWKSKTNIPVGASFDLAQWELIEGGVDYLGYIPNDSGQALFGEQVFVPENNELLTKDFSVSADSQVLAFQAIEKLGFEKSIGRVLVYMLDKSKYVLGQIITQPSESSTFGEKVSVSPDGKFIAITDPYNSRTKISKGTAFIYKKSPNNGYIPHQELFPLQGEEAEKFGFSINWGQDSLAIASLNGDSVKPTTFDNALNTSFDRGFTKFSENIQDTGVVYLYENINNVLINSEKLFHSIPGQIFGENVLSNFNHVYVGLSEPRTSEQNGSLFNYRKNISDFAWKKIRELTPPVDVSGIESAFLYNRRTDTKLMDLDFIDPIQGKIAAPAATEITFKTHYDPAYYNVGEKNSNDAAVRWAEEHVGELWWDLSTARFT
jgi:hypothetical protein